MSNYSNIRSEIENHRFSISSVILYILLIIGLTAEFLVIASLVEESATSYEFQVVIKFSVILMLIHQFFIIRNFHLLDHLDLSEYGTNGIGNWIDKSRVEDLLRIVLFLLFACLTGEIIYLLIVANKTLSFSFISFGEVNGTKYYDLKWITSFYIWSAFIMSVIMFIWDILGAYYDRVSIKIDHFERARIKDFESKKIVAYPFKNPYHTFIISDIIGLFYWLCILLFIVYRIEATSFWILLVFIAYFVIIVVRVWGEIKVNAPKIARKWRIYKKYTSY